MNRMIPIFAAVLALAACSDETTGQPESAGLDTLARGLPPADGAAGDTLSGAGTDTLDAHGADAPGDEVWPSDGGQTTAQDVSLDGGLGDVPDSGSPTDAGDTEGGVDVPDGGGCCQDTAVDTDAGPPPDAGPPFIWKNAPDPCNGLDDDGDGETDEDPECDDGDPATLDVCLPGGQCASAETMELPIDAVAVLPWLSASLGSGPSLVVLVVPRGVPKDVAFDKPVAQAQPDGHVTMTVTGHASPDGPTWTGHPYLLALVPFPADGWGSSPPTEVHLTVNGLAVSGVTLESKWRSIASGQQLSLLSPSLAGTQQTAVFQYLCDGDCCGYPGSLNGIQTLTAGHVFALVPWRDWADSVTVCDADCSGLCSGGALLPVLPQGDWTVTVPSWGAAQYRALRVNEPDPTCQSLPASVTITDAPNFVMTGAAVGVSADVSVSPGGRVMSVTRIPVNPTEWGYEVAVESCCGSPPCSGGAAEALAILDRPGGDKIPALRVGDASVTCPLASCLYVGWLYSTVLGSLNGPCAVDGDCGVQPLVSWATGPGEPACHSAVLASTVGGAAQKLQGVMNVMEWECNPYFPFTLKPGCVPGPPAPAVCVAGKCGFAP